MENMSEKKFISVCSSRASHWQNKDFFKGFLEKREDKWGNRNFYVLVKNDSIFKISKELYRWEYCMRGFPFPKNIVLFSSPEIAKNKTNGVMSDWTARDFEFFIIDYNEWLSRLMKIFPEAEAPQIWKMKNDSR